MSKRKIEDTSKEMYENTSENTVKKHRIIRCSGCYPIFQCNQLGHIGINGCLSEHNVQLTNNFQSFDNNYTDKNLSEDDELIDDVFINIPSDYEDDNDNIYNNIFDNNIYNNDDVLHHDTINHQLQQNHNIQVNKYYDINVNECKKDDDYNIEVYQNDNNDFIIDNINNTNNNNRKTNNDYYISDISSNNSIDNEKK